MNWYRKGPGGGGQWNWTPVTLAGLAMHIQPRELTDGVTPDEQSALEADSPNRRGWSNPSLHDVAKFTDNTYIVLLMEPGFGGTETTGPDEVEVTWFVVTPKQSETNVVRTLDESDRITP